MKIKDLNKRIKFFQGVAKPKYELSKEKVRRELGIVSNIPENYFSEFDNFFEFDDELLETEAARRQFEKIEEDKLINEKRQQSLKTQDDSCILFEEESILEEIKEEIKEEINNFLSLEESEPEEEKTIIVSDNLKQTKPLILKICQFKKENGETCKRQSPHFSDYCKVHRKIMGET